MKKLIYLIALVLIYGFTFSISFAQSDSLQKNDTDYHRFLIKKDIALITGYQVHKNHFAEIGIGIKRHETFGIHSNTLVYGISNEIKLSNDFIWGLKASVWGGTTGINLGLNLINYTNFDKSTLRFRPEIGSGTDSFRFFYGYNLAITNKNFEGINRHNFGLNIILNLKTIEEIKKEP